MGASPVKELVEIEKSNETVSKTSKDPSQVKESKHSYSSHNQDFGPVSGEGRKILLAIENYANPATKMPEYPPKILVYGLTEDLVEYKNLVLSYFETFGKIAGSFFQNKAQPFVILLFEDLESTKKCMETSKHWLLNTTVTLKAVRCGTFNRKCLINDAQILSLNNEAKRFFNWILGIFYLFAGEGQMGRYLNETETMDQHSIAYQEIKDNIREKIAINLEQSAYWDKNLYFESSDCFHLKNFHNDFEFVNFTYHKDSNLKRDHLKKWVREQGYA